MQSVISNKYRQSYEQIMLNYAILGILFFVSPLLGILSTAYYAMHANRSADRMYFFVVVCAIWVSLVNMCKVPESDLINYVDAYQQASKLNLSSWFVIAAILPIPITDYGYVVYTGILSHILGESSYVFKFVTSFLVYLLMGCSIVKYASKLKLSARLVVTLVCILTFTPYIFTISLHLVRQFIASAILFFLVLRRTNYIEWREFIKKNWIYIILMVSFHKSSLFFAVLLCLPFLGKSITDHKFEYSVFCGALVVYQILARVMAGAIGGSSDSALVGTLERASQNTTFELKPLSIIHILLVIWSIISSIVISYKSGSRQNYGIKHTYNIIAILGIFILLNLHQVELSVRFYNYLICFFPLLILVYVKRLKRIPLFFICIINITWWILYVYNGVWTYDLPLNILVSPIPSYFL
jgi:hypothetical protein